MTPVAVMVGANRIVSAAGIIHPLGSADLSPDEEKALRRRIVEQALRDIPDGPINVDDPHIIMPAKDEVYDSIEGMISQFELVFNGVQPPVGEVYFPVEGGNGELGFYVVSTGAGRPYRVRVRPPCFVAMGIVGPLIEGHTVADVVPTFGMMNMIGGECDR